MAYLVANSRARVSSMGVLLKVFPLVVRIASLGSPGSLAMGPSGWTIPALNEFPKGDQSLSSLQICAARPPLGELALAY